MDVSTVTTSDRSLLHAVREVLSGAEDAFLCVAFVQEKGIHLLQKEFETLRRRRVRPRLLVTTTFQTTSQPALSLASRLGLDIRVLNPGSGRTFHPKLYLTHPKPRQASDFYTRLDMQWEQMCRVVLVIDPGVWGRASRFTTATKPDETPAVTTASKAVTSGEVTVRVTAHGMTNSKPPGSTRFPGVTVCAP